ncbi:MAG TPA: methyltransferase domain-containing protein [Terriglobales bacterium]
MSAIVAKSAAATAFDGIAETYDRVFTHSLVGRAQRQVVWEVLDRTFLTGDKVLELNCGTGEDAMHLGSRGVQVVACDASVQMVEVARRKRGNQRGGAAVSFHVLPTERVSDIAFKAPFDGLFSNFAGLNCVTNLHDVGDQLASLVRPGAWMLLCVCTRFCLWESLWHAANGEWKKASRRWSGQSEATLSGVEVEVQYPTVREMKQSFAPWFELRSMIAVGLAIPPSYMEDWSRQHRTLFRALRSIDKRMRRLPLLRVSGDHVLLAFQRSTQ